MAFATPTLKDATIDAQVPVISVRSIALSVADRDDDLQIRVSAPVRGDALPIVIFSHGYGSSMDAYGPLVDYWAAAGFVVIQPTHLDSSRLAIPSSDPRRTNFWRYRIADLRRIIDEVENITRLVPGLEGRVAVDRIAMAGHSFGAWAASMLLGAKTKLDNIDRSDPRISAGLLLAAGGLGGESLTPLAIEHTPYLDTDFSGLKTPTLVVCGDDDHSPLTTRGPDWFRDPYRYSPGASAILTLLGGKHMLGGISGYGAAETDREEPRHVALVQQASTAYLKSVLHEEELTWKTFWHALRHHTQPLGNFETKEPNDLKHHR